MVIILAGRWAIDEIGRQLPLPSGTMQRAWNGVQKNDEWEPIVRNINGMDMVLVPAGCFLMGSTDEQIAAAQDSCDRFYGIYDCLYDFKAAEQPHHLVCFQHPFWIGRTEITHSQFGSQPSANMNTSSTSRSWPAESMTLEQAAAFCEERGLRLPTEAEWEYAARGPDGVVYPWGDEFNTGYLVWHTLYPARAGSIEDGASWVGAHDMSGGVLEWVADWYGPYPTSAPQMAPVGPASGTQRIARGGSWFSYAAFFVRAAHRERFDPGYSSSVVGFRCAADF